MWNKETQFITQQIEPKPGMTISRDLKFSSRIPTRVFSLGQSTHISDETYHRPVLYIGAAGEGAFRVGDAHDVTNIVAQSALFLETGTLCGVETDRADGFVYVEVLLEEGIKVNDVIKAGKGFKLEDLVDYAPDSIVNLDLVSNDAMKFMVMAMDEGTELAEHSAPGDAIVMALDGKAVITYEGKDYQVKAGDSFRFKKGGLHRIQATKKFKFALLLVIE